MDMAALEQALKDEPRARFIYTIPNFQNPSGITMSLEKRKKLYELAREGKEIARKARTIEVYDIRIRRFLPPDRVEMDIDCSKGTYIRTLCADIGKALGCGGHMAELLRTATGSFSLENAIKPADDAGGAERLSRDKNCGGLDQAAL